MTNYRLGWGIRCVDLFGVPQVFQGSKESIRKQIGMAVPCRGARIIFEAILNSFAGIEYEWVEANIDG